MEVQKINTRQKLKQVGRVFLFSIFYFLFFAPTAHAATLFLAPRSGTVLEGSTFDVSVFLDSRGVNINAVELNLKFPPNKLAIVKPSEGKSFITLWIAPPSFSNTKGSVTFAGVVPGGITTDAGLISTITFQAKETGQAVIEVLPSSRVLANDGAGSAVSTEFGKGLFTISPRPPEGVRVFSETHPFEDQWYNNNSPALSWEKEKDVTDFSFEFDNKPVTVPDNTPETEGTLTAYENVADGLWYFHIKARKEGVWGSTTNFRVRIDTAPPASFTPQVEVIRGVTADKVLVSFFTTDSLSGVDNYEVGIIDKKASPLESPVFVESESPYQLPSFTPGDLRVIVRASDRSGNVRDESLDVKVPLPVVSFAKRHLAAIYIVSLLLLAGITVVHYFASHHVLRILKKVVALIKKEKKEMHRTDYRHHKEDHL